MADLPGIIVHGLCTMAFASRAIIESLCGGDPLRLMRLGVRFARPVFPGDRLTTSIWPGEAPGDYSLTTANSDGVVVLRDGRAKIAATR
jgi:acyl dehydratase